MAEVYIADATGRLVMYAQLKNGSDRGSVDGIPSVSERFDRRWINAKTPIKNLYLTGTDALVHDIVGATIGGLLTAGIVNG
ncbi:MAG: hypothetical protein N2235_15760 [Fischerella sp.]|nr:hypothetical protein [Fischerella sp.]